MQTPRAVVSLALPVLFPAVAYDVTADQFRLLARTALAASGDDPKSLRTAYLLAWGEHGDPNFGVTLKRLGVSLDISAGAPA